MAAHDLTICDGTVLDGSRAPGETAGVAVSAGVVTQASRVDLRAGHEVGADGVLVAPGFVDIQLHRRALRQARPRPTARALLAA